MATGTIPTPPPLPASAPIPPPLPVSAERQLIDKQLDRTRLQVKTVDLAFGLLAITVGALAILLTAAVVDHWLWELGVAARFAVLAVLVAWTGYCSWRWIAPSVARRINPLYAASAIELHQPSLKNSLINYLLVRSHPEEAAVVRDALERQAAADIVAAPVDAAVDRTQVLRLGYALVAVVLALAVYKIASPKDPFQTLARVLAPLADIARPSRVEIREVTPGNTEVFHGRRVAIAAVVKGLRSAEAPQLFYSTADGQIVDVSIAMTSDNGLRWQAELPPEADGVQQDLRYHVRAGDAISEEYRVKVSPAPSITVRSVHCDYPRYTRRPPQTIEDRGDISALEGTRVTLRAEANQPIQSAWIEFDPPAGSGLLEEKAKDGAHKPLPMKSDDRVATGSFLLEWDPQAGAPRHRSYRVRFTIAEGARNERPVVHAIDVQRDLAPEIEILEPRQNRVEIPEDGSREIVVRAVDPDYGVSKVELGAVAGGTALDIPALLDDPAGRTGQIVVKHNFVPREHGLRAGDQVVYWARVADNRASPQGAADPNSARTGNFQFIITKGANSNGASGGDSGEEESSSAGEKSESGGEKSDGEGAGESGGEKKSESGDGGGGENGGEQGGQGKSDQGESGESEQSGAGENNSGDSASSGQNGDQQGGQGTDGSSNSGASGQPQENGSQGQSPEGQNSPNPNPSGAPGAKQGGPSTSQSGGVDPQGDSSEGAESQQPLSSDGTQDREVFERLQKYLQEKQGQNNSSGGANQKQPGQAQSQNSSGDSTQANQPPGESGDQGASKTPQPGQSPQGAGQRDSSTPAQQPDQKHGEAEGENSGAGQGGSPKGPAETKKEQANPQKQPGEKQPAPGQGDNGNSGAGARPENPRGSPESQEANRDRQKNGEGSDQESRDDGASSPSTSKRQSDSQGGQGGDRSGGGQQGGGQSAKQPGNDSAGSSSAADEGAGAASEQGAGETSNQPGSQQLSNHPTGNPSQNTPGEGSGVQQNPQGGVPQQTPSQNGQSGGNQPSPPTPGASPSPTAAEQSNREGGGQHTFGAQPQGGVPDQNQPQNQAPPPPVPEDAQVNLEYARKATDLALEALRDQKSKPDAELLEKLGWSEEDLQRFLARWEAMQQAAAQDGRAGDEARQTLRETLESLGLRPTNSGLRRGQTASDEQRALRDSGHRTAPPPEYQKLFDAYLKGAGRAKVKP
jgi:hypothetical protein